MYLRAAFFTALLAILAPAQSEAMDLLFYSKNDCRGDVKMSINAFGLRGTQRRKLGPLNDEFRSMKIMTSLPDVADMMGPMIQLYDDPHGRIFHDDEAWITIRDVRDIPPDGTCIGSFEKPRSDHILVQYFRKNGLDGKVSMIETICNDICLSRVQPAWQEPDEPRKMLIPPHLIRRMDAELLRLKIPR